MRRDSLEWVGREGDGWEIDRLTDQMCESVSLRRKHNRKE